MKKINFIPSYRGLLKQRKNKLEQILDPKEQSIIFRVITLKQWIVEQATEIKQQTKATKHLYKQRINFFEIINNREITFVADVEYINDQITNAATFLLLQLDDLTTPKKVYITEEDLKNALVT